MRRSQRTSIDANSACASSSKSRHSRCLRGPVSIVELLFCKRRATPVNGARCMQLLPVMIDAHVKYNVCTCTHSRGSSLSEGHCSCSSLLSPERKRVTPCEALSSAHSNHLNHSHAIASCTKPAAGPAAVLAQHCWVCFKQIACRQANRIDVLNYIAISSTWIGSSPFVCWCGTALRQNTFLRRLVARNGQV